MNICKKHEVMKHKKELEVTKKECTNKKKLIDLPLDLHEQIEESAKKNVRSVNKEIVFLLTIALGK